MAPRIFTAQEIAARRAAYSGPVAKFLDLGEPAERPRDYTALGVGAEHADDLLRLYFDSNVAVLWEVDNAGWAWIHAGRAIAQLRHAEAIAALINRAADEIAAGDVFDAFFDDTLPELATTGTLALAPAKAAAERHFAGERDPLAMSMLAELISTIGNANPECRDESIASLRDYVARPETTGHFCDTCITCLLEMDAEDALPEIEAAFDQGRCGIYLPETWEEIAKAFGKPGHRPDLAKSSAVRIAALKHAEEERLDIADRMSDPGFLDSLEDDDDEAGEFDGSDPYVDPDAEPLPILRSKNMRKTDPAKKKAKRKAEKKARKKSKR